MQMDIKDGCVVWVEDKGGEGINNEKEEQNDGEKEVTGSMEDWRRLRGWLMRERNRGRNERKKERETGMEAKWREEVNGEVR